MNLILKYKNQNENIVHGNCAQILRLSNTVRRCLDGHLVSGDMNPKYESIICGVGAMPDLDMKKELTLECSEQISQTIPENKEIEIKHQIAEKSLFCITESNQVIPLDSIEDLQTIEQKCNKVVYRPIINVYATKLTSEVKNMDSIWKLELLEA